LLDDLLSSCCRQFFNQVPDLKRQIQSSLLSKTPYFSVGETDSLYLAAGGAFSGTQFHHHADGWNVQLYGRKRWLLYPPDEM
jgi:hypothetical protein